MKHKLYALLLCTAMFMVTSCGGEPTFDADKPEESVKLMLEELEPEKQKEFQGAMLIIGLGAAFSRNAAENPLQKIDGKTAEEIISLVKEGFKK